MIMVFAEKCWLHMMESLEIRNITITAAIDLRKIVNVRDQDYYVSVTGSLSGKTYLDISRGAWPPDNLSECLWRHSL